MKNNSPLRLRALFAPGILLIGTFTQSAYCFYNPSTGRWLSRDPSEERAGPALYAVCANSCLARFDPLGLNWRIDRRWGDRAHARPGPGDTVDLLAHQTDLNAREYRLWLRPVGPTRMPSSEHERITDCADFTVPNTIYADVPDYNILSANWISHRMVNAVVLEGFRAGLNVVLTERSAVDSAVIRRHLRSPNLFKYFYLGHGYGGALSSGTGDVPQWAVSGEKYTRYGIAGMWLTACGASLGDQAWKLNVSHFGWLIVADDDDNDFGTRDLLEFNYRFVHGPP